jgi:integrase
MNIKTSHGRDQLEPRAAPYFVGVERGWAIGYRRNKIGGVWLIRQTVNGKHTHHKADVGGVTDGEQYAHVHRILRSMQIKQSGGMQEDLTLLALLNDYVDAQSSKQEGIKAARSASDIKTKCGQIILKPVQKLKEQDFQQIYKALATSKTGRIRQPTTIGRIVITLRASINQSKLPRQEKERLNEWMPKPPRNKPRHVYLTKDERLDLIETAESYLKPLLELMMILPVRPGALTKRQYSDIDFATGQMKITGDKGKSHDRVIHLNQEALAILKRLCTGLSGDQLIFPNWRSSMASNAFTRAVHAVGADKDATTYSFRHSRITDLCKAFKPIQIAKLSGTSLDEIVQTYYRDDAEQHAAMLNF